MNLIVHPPKLAVNLFSNYVWRINTNEKKIFLTFDDGPTDKITEKIIHILKKYNAKATFFCVGQNIFKFPDVFKLLVADNDFAIGNHTFNHLNGLKTNLSLYIHDFKRVNELMPTNLFRPPYGKISFKQSIYISSYNKIIYWDVMPMDYDNKISPQKCFNNIKKYTNLGSIIVLHDNIKAEKNMFYSLKKTLDYYSERDFIFEKIEGKYLKCNS